MSKKVIYHISGFDCPNCASKTERFLNKQENILSATIDFQNERLFITYKDEALDVEDLKSLIKKIEDDPLRIELQSSNKAKKHSILTKEFIFNLSRIIISFVILITTLILEKTGPLADNFVVCSILYGVAAAICIYDIIWKVINNIIHLRNPIDMNLLLTISCIGVFVLSILVHCNVLSAVEGLEMDTMDGAMVIVLYQIGEMFEHIATSKSKDAISNAIDLRADTANLITDNKVVQVKPETLKIGDKILVRIGEIIPADGKIIDGQGTLDMSSLTGEPMPVDALIGMNALSGSILKSGSITLEVNKVFSDSTISKILELVQSSGEHKAKAEKFITKFARIYTPVVFFIAIVFALIYGFTGNPWTEAIYRGLAILVVACPCAIVISVPLAYFAGVGLASKRGIVIKGTNFLDSLDKIGTLFMDKTGTLTYGNFKVADVIPIGISKDEFYDYVLAAESRSNHPIAKAICLHKNTSKIALEQDDYEEIPGLGTKTIYKKHRIIAGNHELMLKYGISCDEINVAGTPIYIGLDDKFIGYLVLKDVVRDKAKLLIKKLHKLGIKVVLLSGDKMTTVQEVANEVGIDEYYAKLLPQDKTKFVEDAITNKTDKKLVAFAGDGINDTPSIIRADVGYAMGGIGSDVAVENSDVVIMQDHPLKIYDSIIIAKKTKFVAIFNIIFSLLIKVLVIVLLTTGAVSNMVVAVIADTGLTVLMTLHSLSLLYRKIK